jgi:hypothetical protein
MDLQVQLVQSAEVECVLSTSERIRGVVYYYDAAQRVLVLTQGSQSQYRLINAGFIREVKRKDQVPSRATEAQNDAVPTKASAAEIVAGGSSNNKQSRNASPAAGKTPSSRRIDVKLPPKGG